MPRPRLPENYAGTAIGAVVGGILGGAAGAAILGAGLGALTGSVANATRPVPLDRALANFVASKGLTFGGMERRGWSRVRVVFGVAANYFYVDAGVPANRSLYPNVDALEDALFDAAVREIEQARSLYGIG